MSMSDPLNVRPPDVPSDEAEPLNVRPPDAPSEEVEEAPEEEETTPPAS